MGASSSRWHGRWEKRHRHKVVSRHDNKAMPLAVGPKVSAGTIRTISHIGLITDPHLKIFIFEGRYCPDLYDLQ